MRYTSYQIGLVRSNFKLTVNDSDRHRVGKEKRKKKKRNDESSVLRKISGFCREKYYLRSIESQQATGLDFNIQLDECLGIRLRVERVWRIGVRQVLPGTYSVSFAGYESVDWKSRGSGGS